MKILPKPGLIQSGGHGLELFHAVADSPSHDIRVTTQAYHGVTEQDHIRGIIIFF